MKKFMRRVTEWKAACCFAFTGCALLYALVCLFMGRTQIRVTSLLYLLGLTAVATGLQYLCFTQALFKKMRYTARLLLFAALLLPVLVGAALLLEWFPSQYTSAWVLFGLIFLAVLAVFTAGFELYFRLAGRRYDGLLGRYRAGADHRQK